MLKLYIDEENKVCLKPNENFTLSSFVIYLH